MTEEVICCFDDDEVEEVASKMSDRQVRRMPVLSREDESLVGIVSLGDISRSEQSEAAHSTESPTRAASTARATKSELSSHARH